MSLRVYSIWLVAAFLFVPTFTSAEEIASEALPSPLNLEDAVHYALAHHPAVRAESAVEQKAEANLDTAKARYLPRGDIGLQENRATGNVVPGAHFTMAGIPPISGPPRDRVFDSGDWGSTAGLSLWWDIAHLSEKIALADAALAQRAGARAGMQSQVLEVAFGAADAFAASVAAGEEVK